MKTSTITKTVEVTISNAEVLRHFVKALAGELKVSTDKQRTFYYALGHLVGVSDTDAVETANDRPDVKEENYITVEEFRLWLPTVFAEFARVMLEADDA